MVHLVIHHIDPRAQSQTKYGKNETADIFPFPGNQKDDPQYKRRDQVDQEGWQLLPQRQFRIKGIQCEQADK